MMIYEFYGCPGCGKSTLIKETKDLLDKKGIPYRTFNDIYFGSQNNKLSRVSSHFSSFFNPKQIRTNCSILKFALQTGGVKSTKYALRLISLCAKLEAETGSGLILLDEGIIQFISSLSFDSKLNAMPSLQNLINSLKTDLPEIQPVECRLNLDENIVRLRKRGNSKPTRYNSITSDETLKKLLTIKSENLSLIAGCFTSAIVMDMTVSPEINAQKIVDIITQN